MKMLSSSILVLAGSIMVASSGPSGITFIGLLVGGFGLAVFIIECFRKETNSSSSAKIVQ